MYYVTQQENVRRNSRLLILLLILTVIIIIALLTLVLSFYTTLPYALAYAVFLVLLIVGSSSTYRFISLSGGGSVVANQLGAILVDPPVNDFQMERLRNVIEEISIASGVQVPAIYVLNNESGINAFASGFSTSDAAITVTRGALNYLNRDELQAVIAHEFSHILNGDMRLNLRMVALLFGLMMMGVAGKKIITIVLRGRVRGKGVIYVLLLGLILMLLGFTGWFCGKLIKAGINRQREFLADASAVQFTRETVGIAGALKKIAALENGSIVANPNAEEFGHMFFSQESIPLANMFATHPPLLDRIRIIDPKFSDKEIDDVARQLKNQSTQAQNNDKTQQSSAQTTAAVTMLAAAAGAGINTSVPVTSAAVIAHVTESRTDHYQNASVIIKSFPEVLKLAAHNYYGVMPLIIALLFSSDEQIAAQQETVIKMNHSETMLAATKSFYTEVNKLDAMQRLPLLAICFPVLRQHPRADLDKFAGTIKDLIHADLHINIHEYCLGNMLSMQIRDFLRPVQSSVAGSANLDSVNSEISSLMMVIAEEGTSDAAEAEQAYLAGMNVTLPGIKTEYKPVADFAAVLDQVWIPLDKLNMQSKQLLIQGMITAITYDNKISVEEAELLRTVCALLHVQLPPIFQYADGSNPDN